jgi:hypothetical protein
MNRMGDVSAEASPKGEIDMSRGTTLASVCAVLIVFVILAMVVGSTQGQGAATGVKGFPFVQIGQSYYTHDGLNFKVMQDLGNGWIAVQVPYTPDSQAGGKGFVNLNAVTGLLESK